MVDLSDKVKAIDKLHKSIGGDIFSVFAKACAIGRKLYEIKNELPHGEFLNFVEINFTNFKLRTAQRYMLTYKNRDLLKAKYFKDGVSFNLSYALRLLKTKNVDIDKKNKEIQESMPQKIYLVKKIYTDMGFIDSSKKNKYEQEDLKYPTKIEHTTYESALVEAKRLQALHGGCFMVFESIYYITSVEVKQEGRFN
jgi:hypothetical protein